MNLSVVHFSPASHRLLDLESKYPQQPVPTYTRFVFCPQYAATGTITIPRLFTLAHFVVREEIISSNRTTASTRLLLHYPGPLVIPLAALQETTKLCFCYFICNNEDSRQSSSCLSVCTTSRTDGHASLLVTPAAGSFRLLLLLA
jgi:hypothetical protein